MTQMTIAKGINNGLRVAMEKDSRVVLMGEDIGKLGGVFRVTDGLQKDFGEDRVIDTPLAEASDRTLLTHAREPRFRAGAMVSRIAQLTLVDCIFLGVAQRRHAHTVHALERTADAAVCPSPQIEPSAMAWASSPSSGRSQAGASSSRAALVVPTRQGVH